MDLSLLTNGTPTTKPWLNIVAQTIDVDKVYQITKYYPVTTSPVTIPIAGYVGATIYTYGADRVINTPSATEFKTYFGGTPDEGFSFETYVYKNAAFNTTINLGAGVTEYRLSAASISMASPSPTYLLLRYVFTAGAWIVFY